MKRGEVWTVAGGSAYTGKPRPAVIVQQDHFDDVDSIVLCPMTTNPVDVAYFRPGLMPSDQNGISQPSRVMIDKIVAVPRGRLGKLLGELDRRDMARIDRAMFIYLGMAGTRQTTKEPEE